MLWYWNSVMHIVRTLRSFNFSNYYLIIFFSFLQLYVWRKFPACRNDNKSLIWMIKHIVMHWIDHACSDKLLFVVICYDKLTNFHRNIRSDLHYQPPRAQGLFDRATAWNGRARADVHWWKNSPPHFPEFPLSCLTHFSFHFRVVVFARDIYRHTLATSIDSCQRLYKSHW